MDRSTLAVSMLIAVLGVCPLTRTTAHATDCVVMNTDDSAASLPPVADSLRDCLGRVGPGDRVVFDPDVFDLVNSDAATVIWAAGTMTRDGQVGPGGNNVMAASAADAFTSTELKELRSSSDRLAQGFANIISLRQRFNRLDDQSWGNEKAEGFARRIDTQALALETLGWKPSDRPTVLGTAKAPRLAA